MIDESENRIYNDAVDRSFRMGMMWFIFSEVMFFAAFFGALFYARNLSVPWLGGEGAKVLTKILRGDSYESAWPTNGPVIVGGDLRDDSCVRPAGDQHCHPADLRRHHHHRAPCDAESATAPC